MQWANNYGGLLQCYALSSYLLSNGYDVEVVNYWPLYALQKRAYSIGKENVETEFGDVANRLKDRKIIHRLKNNADKCRKLDEFRKTYLPLCKPITDERHLKQQLSTYDIIVSGSDQIWNPKITGGRFDDAYFINFTINGKKVAYAASTGIELPEKYKTKFYALIDKFDCVSAREKSLSEDINKHGKEASVVLDPVFLLGSDRWKQLASGNNGIKHYILVYTLENNRELIKTVNRIQRETGLPLVVIGSKNTYRKVELYADKVSVEEFLGYILHADYVITNSFHGTAFSVIFEKKFIVFPHSTKPARMVDLLKQLKLDDRIIYTHKQAADNKTINTPIDYGTAKAALSQHIGFSKEYLQNAITGEVQHRPGVTVSESLCSGCSACAFICPRNAISMKITNGFYRAVIDREKCIDCGKCIKVCPHTHAYLNHSSEVYAFKHKNDEIRANSSSGGFFSAISEYVINQGGVVYGAAYEKDKLNVNYVRCISLDSVQKCRQSKYVQANMGECFQQIESDLKRDALVLFTGTPCHVQGLINYLDAHQTDREKLITADIICHGTPSPVVFNSFIQFLNTKYKSPVRQFVFRDKTHGWRGHGYKALLANGENIINDYYSMAWNKLFTLSMNDVCFQCQYACTERVSYYTMGDFWGIENSDCAKTDDNMGVSLVLCNTQKGKVLFFDIVRDGEIQETSFEYCKKSDNNKNNFRSRRAKNRK